MVVKHKLVTDIQKERGSPSVTRPTPRGSGIARIVRTSNAEAHAVCIYTTTHSEKPKMTKSYRMYAYNIPMNVIVALSLDYSFGTARFLGVKHKAQITLFLYIDPHPRLHHSQAGHRHGNSCKFKHYFRIMQEKRRKSFNFCLERYRLDKRFTPPSHQVL